MTDPDPEQFATNATARRRRGRRAVDVGEAQPIMRTLRYSVTGSTLGDFELTVAESSTLKHTPVRFDQIGADTQGIIGELGTPTYTQLSPTTRDALFAAAELVFSAITDLGETRTPSKGVAMLELSDADGYAREVSWGRWTIEEESPAFAPS